ncbi:zinc finger MYM-type protein 1-like, partial [Aphis craccivora]
TLRTATTWLNEWEYNMSNGFINKNEFLTKATAEGLRISLESTINLSNYLLNECNFIYVLTGKLNQDCLEKFFVIIRQVAGPNDHPFTPTFL